MATPGVTIAVERNGGDRAGSTDEDDEGMVSGGGNASASSSPPPDFEFRPAAHAKKGRNRHKSPSALIERFQMLYKGNRSTVIDKNETKKRVKNAASSL